VSFADAGVEVRQLEDHRSGTHHAVGSLMTCGLEVDAAGDEPIDVLHVAPTILDALGVEPPSYHRSSLLDRATVSPT
jgi:hypothetical protein